MRVNRTYGQADAARGDAGDTRERHPATRVQAPAFNLPSAPPRDYEPAGAEGRQHPVHLACSRIQFPPSHHTQTEGWQV